MKTLRPLFLTACVAAAGLGYSQASSLTHAWTQYYDGPTHHIEGAALTAHDEFGNLYVCGTTAISPAQANADFVLLKYDPFGNLLWTQPFNGLGDGQDIAAGVRYKNGHLYVIGRTIQPTNWYADSDMTTIKYRADDGSVVWSRTYSGVFEPGVESSIDGATAVAIDDQDNVYVTGFTWEWTYYFSNSDYRTLKYNASGDLQWTKAYHGGANWVAISDQATVIEVGHDGNIFVSGDSPGPSNGSDWATIKYNAVTGDEMWVSRSPEVSIDLRGGVARAMEVGSDGYLYVAGSAFNDASGIIKYDPTTGAPVWFWVQNVGHWGNRYAFALASNNDPMLALVYDPDSDDSNNNNNSRLIRFDSLTGVKKWTSNYGNSVFGDFQAPRAITEMPNGNILLAGVGTAVPYNSRLMLLQYKPDGALESAYFHEENPQPIETRIVFADTFGGIVMGGTAIGPSATQDLITLKFLQPSPVAPPTALATSQGASFGNSIADIFHSEDHRMSFLPSPTSGFAQATSTSKVLMSSPTSLGLTLESRVTRNLVTTRVEVKNQVTGQWEILDEFAATLTDQTKSWSISVNPGRFIHPTTHDIETRISWIPGTIIRNSNKWAGSIDVLEWRAQ